MGRGYLLLLVACLASLSLGVRFQCEDGTCIDEDKVCDGMTDCSQTETGNGGEDEDQECSGIGELEGCGLGDDCEYGEDCGEEEDWKVNNFCKADGPPPPPTTSPPTDPSVIIIGAVVGGLVGLLVLLAAAYFGWKKVTGSHEEIPMTES